MGVMACDRKGCSEIMCNKYSSDYGYICDDCYEELTQAGWSSIPEFMESEKPRTLSLNWEKYLANEFKDRR